jgi:hypothetical protein
MHDRALDRGEELGAGLRRYGADDAAGHQETEGVDGVGRVGNEHHVARPGDRLGHVGEAFLRAERGHDLGLGVELDPEPARVIARLRPTQAGDAFRSGITVGARLADRLDQLVDHVFGRGQVGVAHAEVDDIGAAGPRLGLELIDLLEDIRRQAPHPVKVAHFREMPLNRFPPRRLSRRCSVTSDAYAPQTGYCYCWALGALVCGFFFAAA